MKVHFDKQPAYLRFEGNDIFVSSDGVLWYYFGTLVEDGE